MGTEFSPDLEQGALPLVVAGVTVVGLDKVSSHDGAVDRGDDLGEIDLSSSSGEDVTATGAAFRPHQPGSLESKEDLFQVRLGQSSPARKLCHRRRFAGIVQRQREECSRGVISPRRYLHEAQA